MQVFFSDSGVFGKNVWLWGRNMGEIMVRIYFTFAGKRRYNEKNAAGGVSVADSNITKKALADALKELMETTPFEKISVTEISEACGMNRKSFYYHFKDKYDLVNWIFDVETRELVASFNQEETYTGRMEFLEKLCDYLYENRDFYRRALKIEGQNSLSDHIREYTQPVLKERFVKLFPGTDIDEFYVEFFSDACCCAIERWLKNRDCIPPRQFVAKVDTMLRRASEILSQELREKREKESATGTEEAP